jgi:hypothetical protein
MRSRGPGSGQESKDTVAELGRRTKEKLQNSWPAGNRFEAQPKESGPGWVTRGRLSIVT